MSLVKGTLDHWKETGLGITASNDTLLIIEMWFWYMMRSLSPAIHISTSGGMNHKWFIQHKTQVRLPLAVRTMDGTTRAL